MERDDELTAYVETDPPESLPALTDDSLIALSEEIEGRVLAIERIMKAIVRFAGPKGIDNLGGNAYVNAGGCTRIANGLGISWTKPEERRHSLDGGYTEFEFEATFLMGSRSCPAVGSRSSKDPFYSQKGRDSDGNPIFLDPADIDLGNVRKAAHTNMIGNGIRNILGLKNLDWDDLMAIGLDQKKARGKVNYGKAEISKDAAGTLEECKTMLLALSDGDIKAGADLLEEMTTFTNKEGKVIKGKRDLAKVSEAQLVKALHPALVKRYNEWTAQYDKPVTADEAAAAFGGEVE
jgi:hypothetical protein